MGTKLPFALLDAPVQICGFASPWKNKVNISQAAPDQPWHAWDQHQVLQALIS